MSGHYSVDSQMIPLAEGLWTLIVYDEGEPVQGVERILLNQGMRTRHVHTCSEATTALREPGQPALVLTDASLPDGTWADVITAARIPPTTLPVIVVSRFVDIKFYCHVMESGAYDFVVPPLTSADLDYIVRGAILKGSTRFEIR
jgi:DNA-binding NtrC family response regulator